MEWITLVVGVILGYFIEKLMDRLLEKYGRVRSSSYFKKVENAWKEYQGLSYGLELIQIGWNNGCFSPDEVVITLDGSFQLPKEIKERILDKHRLHWVEQNMTDDVQFGIIKIDPHRISDNHLGNVKITHQLRIWGQTYQYFEFLATHKTLYYGPQEEKELLQKLTDRQPHYLEPNINFPNILSVGLSFFAEKGNCLVLTRRTSIASSGGHWSAGLVFNAVGECVSPKDIVGDYEGLLRISPWVTAKRGLYEEMGISYFDEDRSSTLQIHSFAWDYRILDYKFFGYVINDLSRADVRRNWEKAPDRNENWNMDFYDTATRQQCINIFENILFNRTDWSSEAIFCTCLSLLQMGKITYKDMQSLLDNYPSKS